MNEFGKIRPNGIEAAAREISAIIFFAETMTLQSYDWLLTAHHADDRWKRC